MNRFAPWVATAALSLGVAGIAYSADEAKTGTMGASTVMLQKAGAAPAKKLIASCPLSDDARIQAGLRLLHEADRAEIRLANLALQRAASPEVRAFASQVRTDDLSTELRLETLANQLGYDLDLDLNDPIQAGYQAANIAEHNRLKARTGRSFEASYLGPLAGDHDLAVEAIAQSQRVTTMDTDLRKLLNETRITLALHQHNAAQLMDQVFVSNVPLAIGGGPKAVPSTGGKP